VRTWAGVAAPKGLPADILKKLNADMLAGLADSETKEKLNKIGLDIQPSTPDGMKALVAEQVVKWKKVVADAQIPQQ
jgi:tripartite-type tricarboxylate transporter receptor subunit TctC